MLSADDIKEVLKSRDKERIFTIYESIYDDKLDRNCGSCYQDAVKRLQIRVNKLERENVLIK